ncbi:hypothetical protein IEQ34_013072 [Dendrobium chrysotoxum]|uniref:GPI-anchored protein LLG1-like domain-containing protein n=1 Tax=Dendrobium chrysotoxum TaxID=161865 RepID=A0AAV7GQA8_DENCH|nr:hypothetical protein IEQ34_013072 [Dendrobium chrysotoxum]
MNLTRRFFLRAALFVLLAGSSAAALFISGDAIQAHGSAGRNLLQAKQHCLVNFQFMNYTIITSKCKGPQYAANPCCSAFKEFACPYADQLNDQTNDCSFVMFSYINQYGKYPTGLFSSECKDGKQGLNCTAYISKQDNSTSSSSARMHRNFILLVSVVSGFVMANLLHCIL